MANTLANLRKNSSDENSDFYFLIIDEPVFWLSLAVIGFMMCATIVIANSILLLTTYKDPRRSLRTPPCFLIANLGASDFLLGTIVVFLVALRDVYRYLQLPMQLPTALRPVGFITLGTTLFVSSATIIALSISCYVAISDPIEYKTRITKKRILIFIVLLWVAAFLLCLLPVTNISEEAFTLAFLHTHITLPAIVLTVIYIKVFRALARKTRELKLSVNDSAVSSRHALERERTMVVAIIIVLALFYMTYLPQYTTLHLLYFCPSCQESVSFHKVDVVLSRFLFLNSAINPLIYAWRVPKYRRAFIDCWKILKNRLGLQADESLPNVKHRHWVSLEILRRNRIKPRTKSYYGSED